MGFISVYNIHMIATRNHGPSPLPITSAEVCDKVRLPNVPEWRDGQLSSWRAQAGDVALVVQLAWNGVRQTVYRSGINSRPSVARESVIAPLWLAATTTRPPSHPTTRPPGCPANWQTTRPPGHQPTWPHGRLRWLSPTRPPGYPTGQPPQCPHRSTGEAGSPGLIWLNL